MHGVHDRRRRTDRAGFAATLRAERIVRARRDLGRHLERRQIVGARQRVVHEAAGQQLAGLRVVDAVLDQRLADALREPAMDLALDDHRIDDVAEVVAGAKRTISTTPVSGSISTSQMCVPAGNVKFVGS